MAHSIAVGDLYFGALLDGQLVHLSWVTRTKAWLPDLYAAFALDPTEAYLANTFTLPEYRGRGIQPAVFQTIFRHASSLGIRRQFGCVRKGNHAGTRSFAKHGKAIRIWAIHCRRFRGIRGRWITGIDQPGLPRMSFPAGFERKSIGRMGLWVRPPPGHRMHWTMVPPDYGI
jgi:GNAT superfamily N-acetyltransferase